MRARVLLVTVLVSALIPMRPAAAATCDSTLFDGNAYISGSSAAESFTIRHNSVTGNIECELNGGGFGVVGVKASIGRIDINTGSGSDELVLGDDSFPFEDLSGTPVFATTQFAGVLRIDASNSPLAHTMTLDDFGLTSNTTSGQASVRYGGFTTLLVSNGPNNDSFIARFPLAGGVTVDGGVGTDALEVHGSLNRDRIVAIDTGRFEWNDAHGVNHTGFESLTLRGGGGNDSIKGGPLAEAIFGEGGRDKLNGAGGGDELDGGTGIDSCTGGPGKDTFKSCETKRQ
jgi:Ca2+-binding RTX toxin-like protein